MTEPDMTTAQERKLAAWAGITAAYRNFAITVDSSRGDCGMLRFADRHGFSSQC